MKKKKASQAQVRLVLTCYVADMNPKEVAARFNVVVPEDRKLKKGSLSGAAVRTLVGANERHAAFSAAYLPELQTISRVLHPP